MSIHSLLGAVPPARGDGTPWSLARVQEAGAETGAFAEVAVLALSPLDPDPLRPMSRNLTFNGLLDIGWYRIVWQDPNNNVSPPTAAVYDDVTAAGAPSAGAWLPTVDDVASLLRARTKDRFGNEIGRFTPDTRPTDAQVFQLINMSASLLQGCAGPWLPESLWELSRTVIAARAAMLIEMSYYPEQTGADDTVYNAMRRLYNEMMPKLCAIADPYRPDDVPYASDDEGPPAFYFGDGVRIARTAEYDPGTQTVVYRFAELPVGAWWSS